MRARLERAFEHFIECSTRSDQEVAAELRRREIDMVVDLSGHFGSGRLGALALRPCPIQVNYLGYPGTLGADFYDYVIADPIVLPFDEQPFFSERVVHLPLHDVRKADWRDHRALGTGVIELDPLLRTLRAIGYDGLWQFELEEPEQEGALTASRDALLRADAAIHGD